LTNSSAESPASLADIIGQLALSKKAENVVALDVRGLSGITDCFLVCSADTDIQVKAIADAIRRGTPHKPVHVEGYENLHWVLLDYIDIVVHVFKTSERNYYNIEKLWSDAPTKVFEDDTESLSQSTSESSANQA